MDSGHILILILLVAIPGLVILTSLWCGMPILPALDPRLGRHQRVFLKCPAGDTLASLLEQTPPEVGATIRVITNTFPTGKWGEHTHWYKFVSGCLDRGCKVKAYGALQGRVTSELESLVGRKLEVFILPEVLYEHYCTVDAPKQIWAESDHVDFHAEKCIYTKEPTKAAWELLDRHFADLERNAIPYEKWVEPQPRALAGVS